MSERTLVELMTEACDRHPRWHHVPVKLQLPTKEDREAWLKTMRDEQIAYEVEERLNRERRLFGRFV